MKKKIMDFAKESLKSTFMSNEKSERSKHADTVIRNHIIWSMGASFIIPIPIADIFAVSALQLDMIRQLCRVYDVDFSETQGKAIVTSLTSSTLARAGARSLIKLVPGLGTLIGGVTVSVFNGASTFALGEVFKKHFQSGGTILDFDVDRLKKVYREKFEKGKDVADQLRKEEGGMKKRESQPSDESSTAKMDSGAANDAVIARIKELASMKDQGIISEEEFQEMKKKLIEGL
jgi:uncharacterized protein (DUF697 family)